MSDLQEYGMAFATCSKLSKIADRIEAEWMELPRDRDGEIIHVGDEVECNDNLNGRICSPAIVESIRYSSESMSHVVVCGFAMRPSELKHIESDTWERIEADAGASSCCKYFLGDSCKPELDRCEHCPANMGNDVTCDEKMHLDLVRRCKALAGECE